MVHTASSTAHTARLTSRRVLISAQDAELAQRVGSVFAAAGAVLQREPVNCADGSDGTEAAAAAVRELGGIDVLVNIGPASLTGEGSTEPARVRQVEEALTRAMSLLVTTTEAALPSMPPGGSIINATAVAAGANSPAQDALAAAVIDTTQGWAEILGSRGIRANAVIGGTALGSATAAERPGRPGHEPQPCDAEQLDAFVYLASEDASCVSGSVVTVARTHAARQPGEEEPPAES